MQKKRIDARGLTCPRPILLAKEALNALGEDSGQIEIVVDNKTAVENMKRMAASYGIKALVEDAVAGNYSVVVEKTAGIISAAQADPQNDCTAGQHKVLLLAADTIGTGSDELGALLMRSFLYTLAKAENPPEKIIMMNAGVKLAVSGSSVLEELRALEVRGVVLLACGTCLDYYNLSADLAVGRVSNMYDITAAMLAGDSVIRV